MPSKQVENSVGIARIQDSPFFGLIKEIFGSEELKILDVACGSGTDTRKALEKGFNAYGIDYDIENIGVGYKYYKDRGILLDDSGLPRIICADVTEPMPFRDDSFHGIYANAVMCTFKEKIIPFFREMVRLLKDGGVIYGKLVSDKLKEADPSLIPEGHTRRTLYI